MAPPKDQTQANTKYNSYNSLAQSGGVFSGVSKVSSKWQSIWMSNEHIIHKIVEIKSHNIKFCECASECGYSFG